MLTVGYRVLGPLEVLVDGEVVPIQAYSVAEPRSLQLSLAAASTVLTAAFVGLARAGEAVEHGEDALAMHRTSGYRLREARTLCHLGDAHRLAGEERRAVTRWQSASRAYAVVGTAE